MTAIRSVLSGATDNIWLLVSDNSTIENQKSALGDFCEQLSNSQLHYIQPPKPLSMSQHWEWAMQQALQLPDADHFIYLTDRSMFKAGELSTIAKLVRQYPDEVISYDWVTIFDHLNPIVIREQPHSGQIVEISADRILALSAQSVFTRGLPRMMTCCVPRKVIDAMKQRFGSIFTSISPDYNFCYRCLYIVNSVLFYDNAAFVSYAMGRSNGICGIGVSTEATEDFAKQLALEGMQLCSATPEPAFKTGTNHILHEYCVVKAETSSPKFPEISRRKYLAKIARDILSLENPALKRELESVLKAQQGYNFSMNLNLLEWRTKLALRKRAKKILKLQWPRLAGPPEFHSLEEAIHYASRSQPNSDSPPTI